MAAVRRGAGLRALVAAGRGRDVRSWCDAVRPRRRPGAAAPGGPEPIFAASRAAPVVLSVAGDWSFIPSAWKAIDGEDPLASRPPTTPRSRSWHARCRATRRPSPRCCGRSWVPSSPRSHRRPRDGHQPQLRAIRPSRGVEEVRAKFKYGGNVDAAHRAAWSSAWRARGARDLPLRPHRAQKQRQRARRSAQPACRRRQPGRRDWHVTDIVRGRQQMPYSDQRWSTTRTPTSWRPRPGWRTR